MSKGTINKVIIIGNLGADPEVRQMQSGDAVTNIRVATTDTWKDKATGENQDRTEWHNIVFFRRLAEIAGEYLRKGSKVMVEGSLRTRKWQDKDGNDRYTTEIVASEMQMLGGPAAENGQNNPKANTKKAAPAPAPVAAGFDESEDDSIPF